ncbi:MAG: hypothetical protein QW597_06460 [Thermoplasmataceae archaeon]
MKESSSNVDLKKVISGLKVDVKKIAGDRNASVLTRKNVLYNLSRLRSAENPHSKKEVAVGQILVVLKILSEVPEVPINKKVSYRSLQEKLNTILRDMSASPQLTEIQNALLGGTEAEKLEASENLLQLSSSWKPGVINMIPAAYSNIDTGNTILKRNLAGFFYYISSNNPSLIEKYKLDFSEFVRDSDPTVRGISLLICLKTRDQRLLEGAYDMLQDNSSADLSCLNLPPQTIHFEITDMVTKVSNIAREVVSVLGNDKTSGMNLLKRSFIVIPASKAKRNMPAEITVRADPVIDLTNIEIDLSGLVTHFGVDIPTLSIGTIKAHELREITLRVVPMETGWVKSNIVITNAKVSQEFPFEIFIEESQAGIRQDRNRNTDHIPGDGEATNGSYAPSQNMGTAMGTGPETQGKYNNEICRKNLEILEMDIETREGSKIAISLKSILPCVAGNREFYDQIAEVIDNINALSMFSTSIDDARYNMLKELLRTARSVMESQ